MDGSTPKVSKDRAFEPSKIALGEPAHRLVRAFVDRVAQLESRQRARKPTDQDVHLKQATALALDLTHLELIDAGRWLSVSLKKEHYGTRARSAEFLTEAFPKLISLLASDTTLVDFEKGSLGTFRTGRRSIVRAGSGMRALIKSLEINLSDIGRDPALRGDVIVLKGTKVLGKARKITFDDNEDIRRMRSEVEEINDWIADADLWWAGDEIEDRVDLGDRFLRRIFNGTFDAGGRLFGGFWQRAKSDLRLNCIHFGDCAAVALDFGQMAVRTAYSMQGASPAPGDLYDVPGLGPSRREGTKRVLNALLASDGIPRRFPQGSRKYFPRQWKFSDVYEPIAEHHPVLKPLFGTSQSLRLMNMESNLLVAILLRLKGLGVAALPIHDCLLVSQRDEAVAKEVMERLCMEYLGVEGRVDIDRSTTELYTLGTPSSPLQRGA